MGCIVFSRSRRACSPTGTSTASPRTPAPPATTPRSPASTTGCSTGSASLNEIAQGRGQKLAQLALQWAIRDPRVTSAVIGASSVEQLDTNLDALDFPALTDDELAEIDKYAVESGVNSWAKSDRGRNRTGVTRVCTA